MMNQLWVNYYFYFIAISALCLILEVTLPKNKKKVLRLQWKQDLLLCYLNIHLLLWASIPIFDWVSGNYHQFLSTIGFDFKWALPHHIFIQIVIGLVIKDFLEWCIHNALHRIPLLWEIHKHHHSIKEMDWVGNMRFHFFEIYIYKTFTYLFLVFIQIDFLPMLIIGVFSTLIGHLNHSNLNISWGPFRYLLNSPNMHLWHHDKTLHLPSGQNFAIVFSTWDYLFKTLHFPPGQPTELGFADDHHYPNSLVGRWLYPLTIFFRKKSKQN